MPLINFPMKEKHQTDGKEWKIVHLSDFHYDGKNLDLLANVMSHLVEIGPQFVLVTGDIVDGPTGDFSVPAAMLRSAMRDIEAFHDFTPVLRVVPGNHDFFYKGTYGLRRTRKFYEAFTEEERGNFFRPDVPIAIAAFDSNQLYEPRGGFWRKSIQLLRFMSHGLILEQDLDAFSDWAKSLKRSESADAYRRSFKIAILHHHPMPTKYNFLPRVADESFMMLENAGVFLYRLIQEKFDLILHGHRHFAQFCRAAYFDHVGTVKEISVLGCGSCCIRSDEWTRISGHSFNVITLKEDGSIRATQYVKRGTQDFLPVLNEIEIRGPSGDAADDSVQQVR